MKTRYDYYASFVILCYILFHSSSKAKHAAISDEAEEEEEEEKEEGEEEGEEGEEEEEEEEEGEGDSVSEMFVFFIYIFTQANPSSCRSEYEKKQKKLQKGKQAAGKAQEDEYVYLEDFYRKKSIFYIYFSHVFSS